MIFDFNVGDTFQYQTSNYYNFTYYGGFSIEILEKTISSGNDSVTYLIKRNSYVQNVNQNNSQLIDTNYSTSFQTLVYTDLDTDIKYLSAYNIATINAFTNTYDYYATIDSTCLDYLSFDDSLFFYSLGGITTEAYSADFYDYWSSCNNCVYRFYGQRFGKGLGIISQAESVSGGPSYGNSYNMIYFRKDTVSAGSPNALLSGLKEMNTSFSKVYPNPTKDKIILEISPSNLHRKFRITNNIGQVMMISELNSIYTQLDLSSFSDGLYFLIVDGIILEPLKIIKQ
jgi:hypothetical protein